MQLENCPCGSQQPYANCCEPCHLGVAPAATAERLMRSRYSAFCLGKTNYLNATLHPSKHRVTDASSMARTIDNTTWTQLRIIATDQGAVGDSQGYVEFVATYTEGGIKHQLHERSHFVKEDGRWYYISGEYDNLSPINQPRRNDLCWCGSGKKHKKCHGRHPS